jgi:predicted naringenin-chalcone synthase
VSKKVYATALWSIGTAVPTHRISQIDALDLMLEWHQPEPELARRLRFLYRRSQIDTRYTCCPYMYAPLLSVSRADDPSAWSKLSTQQRMQVYETESVDLAETAAQRALDAQSLFTPADVTHLIVITCTGFVAPGPDLLLLERLGLRPDVHRLQIGFMGCNAVLNGLQTADSICRSDPAAVVLLVSVELCTLHFQPSPTEENLIITSLFGDGAAATVLSRTETRAAPCRIGPFASHVYAQTRDSISWRIEDQGFHMGLGLSNAKDLRPLVPEFVNGFLQAHEWQQSHIGLWAVHPGGRAILDTCERALGLSSEALSSSRAVLRNYGNMSSPSVLFVMQHLLNTPPSENDKGLTLAFGPGISLEGMLWQRGKDHD